MAHLVMASTEVCVDNTNMGMDNIERTMEMGKRKGNNNGRVMHFNEHRYK
jgi:hypothetical protein